MAEDPGSMHAPPVLPMAAIDRAHQVLVGRSILVVDDDAVMGKLYSAGLGARGAAVTVVNSSEAALELLVDTEFDLIIVDKSLPGLSGDELVRALRETDQNAMRPIVMVSGHADVAERMVSYDAGVTDYVIKPVSMTELMAKVSALLRHGDALRTSRVRATRAEQEAMRGRLVERAWQPHFQPIVRLADLSVIGYEALTRFADGANPEICFDTARRSGLGPELEIAVLEDALHAAAQLPGGAWVSVNASPSTIMDPEFDRVIATSTTRIVIELLETEPVGDHPDMLDRVANLPGAPLLACDDTGSGWAGLRQLVELRPQVVKLDRALVSGIDRDPTRRALVSGLRHFTNEIGALLLAEGIETVGELDTLIALDVDLGQGYLLGAPMGLEELQRRHANAHVTS
ncbi:MAG: EAL domain-containing protein [Actinobacteria bacterium]|nr:EAL domain-containing protein [Actinomycetota bacterium]